jgi:hypothetical protein
MEKNSEVVTAALMAAYLASQFNQLQKLPHRLWEAGERDTHQLRAYQKRNSASVNEYLDSGVDPRVIKAQLIDPLFTSSNMPPLDDRTFWRFYDALNEKRGLSNPLNDSTSSQDSPDKQKPDWNVKDWITSDQGKGALGGGALGALLGRKSTLGMMLGTGGGAFLGGYLYPKIREYWTKKTETSV